MTRNPGKNNYQRGFTLLEVLMVITIIGVIAGVTVLSFNSMGQRRFNAEANRLQLAFNQAADMALMQHKIIGWFYEEETNLYTFKQYVQTPESTHQENSTIEWQPLDQAIFSEHELIPTVTVEIKLAESGLQDSLDQTDDSDTPILIFLSSGEYTAFELILRDKQHTPAVLQGDGFNAIGTGKSKQ